MDRPAQVKLLKVNVGKHLMNELTFLDLVILQKIAPDSSVENFGTAINTSFFETANLLGTVKIKGYIGIEPSIGGISKVAITDAGTGILALVEKKKSEPIEPLDNAILHALAAGAKTPELLQSQLNIRSGDLAYHISKMIEQGFMDYSIRSAKITFVLTEQGFNATGAVRVQQTLPASETGEKKGEHAGHAETEHGKEKEAHHPPWARPEKATQKDVEHLLEEEHEHGHEHHEKHDAEHHAHKEHEKKHEEKKEKELTPEEAKKRERHRRMMSKLEHYVAEYSVWLVLLFVVVAIFFGAIFLLLSKNII